MNGPALLARGFGGVALAAILAACTPAARPTAAGGGADLLVVAQQREPSSLNPALENGTSSTQWGLLLFQYLVKYDDRGQLIPDAATEVPTLSNGGISRDGVTITYHIRPGLKFADGAALTARDCAWSITAINDPANNPQSRFGYDVVSRAEARGDTTLVLHLKRPFAPLLVVVLAPQGFPILPAHLLAKLHDFNHIPFNAAPLGSGPYVVTRWRHGDRVEMRANPYYYRGKPRIERLQIRFVPDPNTALNLLRTHEVDGYFSEQDYGNYPLLQQIAGLRVTKTPMNAVGAIVFNTHDPVTSDARVRRALALAIDIPSTMQKTYRGAVDTTNAGRGLFIWAYDRKAYPDIGYDPAQARTLLGAAGWKPGADGIRRKDGRALEVLFIIQAATPGDTIIGNAVTQYERAVGVNVTLKAFNITQFVAPAAEGGPVYGGKFHMALYPFVNGDDPDTSDQFLCANVPPNGYNKSRLCDPRIDALLARGQRTYDVAQRKAIYARLERMLYRAMPIALLYQRSELDAFTERLAHQTTSLSTAWWNVGAWTLSPQAASRPLRVRAGPRA
jgi:peptide/nickel transport system substrate-binding protein